MFGRTVLAALSVAVAACDSSPAAPGGCHRDYRPATQELQQHRARWDALRATSYEYTFERVCFCGPDTRGPYRVRVQNGVIVSTEPPLPASFPAAVLTIPQVFDLIDEAIDERACRIDVRYDALGFPAEGFIDYEAMVADEEMGFRITDVAIAR